MPLLDFLKSLKDAPVANVILIAAILFGVAAVRGQLWNRLDTLGRSVALLLSAALFGVGTMLAFRIIPGPIEGRIILPPEIHDTVTLGDEVELRLHSPTVVISPTPVAASDRTLEVRPTPTPLLPYRKEGPETYVEWGCEEHASGEAALTLEPGEQLVSARIELLEIDKTKSFGIAEPRFDPATRRVVGRVEFAGLDRVFFNCAGGGHARFHIVAQVVRTH